MFVHLELCFPYISEAFPPRLSDARQKICRNLQKLSVKLDKDVIKLFDRINRSTKSSPFFKTHIFHFSERKILSRYI